MSYSSAAYLQYEEYRHMNPDQPLSLWSGGRSRVQPKPLVVDTTRSAADIELANETETERHTREDAWIDANI